MLKPRTMAALTVALTTAASAACAATGDENDAMAVSNAKVSLSQAVSAAEKHVHGRASRAAYEKTSHGLACDVEVVNGQKVVDVTVDAQNGSILASAPDKVDHDNEDDKVD